MKNYIELRTNDSGKVWACRVESDPSGRFVTTGVSAELSPDEFPAALAGNDIFYDSPLMCSWADRALRIFEEEAD